MENKEIEITLETVIDDEKVLLKYKDSVLLSSNTLSCITGKAKSRKSFLKDLLIGKLFSNDNDWKGEFSGTCLVLDTEMSNYWIKQSVERLNAMKVDLTRLRVFAVKHLSTKERLVRLKALIKEHRPEVVVIDGLRDMLLDYNDVKESQELMNELMKLVSVYKINITYILHTNPDGIKVRGTLGSETLNKCDTVLKVNTRGAISTVSSEVMRDKDMNQFTFIIDNDSIPVIQ